MFSDITAFGKERWDVINHNDIIVFLRGVYDRWIEENSGISFATMLTKPAKQPTVPQTGSSTLFISTSLFLMSSGNASNASINTLKLGMMISISSAIEDYKPIDSSIFGNLNGENWVFATEQEIKNNRKNEMITDNFKVFFQSTFRKHTVKIR
jgi:hypothetical protein